MYFEKRIPLMLELGFNENQLPQLKRYIDLLWKSNEELNLISRKMTFEELIDNHVIDCLLPLRYFPKDVKSAADFGSGGGLPGVIYAINFPQIPFHLYEKSPKKQAFLRACQEISPNLVVHGAIPKSIAVDLVTSRAFKPIDVILELSQSYYKNKGRYFLLKARETKIQEEMILAKKKFKSLTAKILATPSPILEVQRHLVLIGFDETTLKSV